MPETYPVRPACYNARHGLDSCHLLQGMAVTQKCYPYGGVHGYYNSHAPGLSQSRSVHGGLYCAQCDELLVHLEVYYPWPIPVYTWVTYLLIKEWP